MHKAYNPNPKPFRRCGLGGRGSEARTRPRKAQEAAAGLRGGGWVECSNTGGRQYLILLSLMMLWHSPSRKFRETLQPPPLRDLLARRRVVRSSPSPSHDLCVCVQEGGTVTPGNSSPMSDGAAALVLASRAAARRMGLPVLAVIRSQADANQAPEWCGERGMEGYGGVWRCVEGL